MSVTYDKLYYAPIAFSSSIECPFSSRRLWGYGSPRVHAGVTSRGRAGVTGAKWRAGWRGDHQEHHKNTLYTTFSHFMS